MAKKSFDDSILAELSNREALIIGVDEVGRGALFGPVVAVAAVLPCSCLPLLETIEVRDSKQLSPKARCQLVKEIEKIVWRWQIGYATAQEIEQLNILQASLLAMRRAVIKLKIEAEICLVDGAQAIPDLPIAQKTLIKGDERTPIIAAASILAKVWRDDLMLRFAQKYPDYDLEKNKGYGTKKHFQALYEYGVSPQHRRTFRPCSELSSIIDR